MSQTTTLLNYLAIYHPEHTIDTDLFKLLERLRELDAADHIDNPVAAQKGICSVQRIIAARESEDFTALSNETQQKINEACVAHGAEQHGRQLTKQIWQLSTAGKYLPKNTVPLNTNELATITNVVRQSGTCFCTEVVQEKLYLSTVGLTEAFFAACATTPAIASIMEAFEAIGLPLVKNFEPAHITLINSDVLHKMSTFKHVTQQFDARDFHVEQVWHSVSLDYAPFSAFLAVELSSPALTAYLGQLEKDYDVQLKKSMHVTVAVCPRHRVIFDDL